MAGLRTAPEVVAIAIKMRGEGMGVRASGRVLEKSHATILRWEKRVAAQAPGWSPNVADGVTSFLSFLFALNFNDTYTTKHPDLLRSHLLFQARADALSSH